MPALPTKVSPEAETCSGQAEGIGGEERRREHGEAGRT